MIDLFLLLFLGLLVTGQTVVLSIKLYVKEISYLSYLLQLAGYTLLLLIYLVGFCRSYLKYVPKQKDEDGSGQN